MAESEVNLADNLCSSATEPFHVGIISIPEASVSLGDLWLRRQGNTFTAFEATKEY